MPDINLGRIGFVPRGDYQSGTSYTPLDAVRHGNRLWACLTQTATAPSSGNAAWKLLLEGVSNELVGIGGSIDAAANTLALRYTDGRLKVSAAVTGDDALQLAQLLAFPAAGGGLTVADGHVYVDFGAMPADKFEAILKSLRLPQWLTANTTLYVNGGTGNDANDGKTSATAFKTMQGILNYISANIHVDKYRLTLSVAAGTYAPFVLTKYQGSTGYIYIQGAGTASTVFSATDVQDLMTSLQGAGRYDIADCGFVLNWNTDSASSRNVVRAVSGTIVNLRRCAFTCTENIENSRAFMCLRVDPYGQISIQETCTFTMNGNGTTSGIYVLDGNGGLIEINAPYSISGKGNCHATVMAGSVISRNPVSLPVVTGSFTGKRYVVSGLGTIYTRGGGSAFFPGTVDGSLATLGNYS